VLDRLSREWGWPTFALLPLFGVVLMVERGRAARQSV
jgi:hypothetical protein